MVIISGVPIFRIFTVTKTKQFRSRLLAVASNGITGGGVRICLIILVIYKYKKGKIVVKYYTSR